jgi:hypothetical protein
MCALRFVHMVRSTIFVKSTAAKAKTRQLSVLKRRKTAMSGKTRANAMMQSLAKISSKVAPQVAGSGTSDGLAAVVEDEDAGDCGEGGRGSLAVAEV